MLRPQRFFTVAFCDRYLLVVEKVGESWDAVVLSNDDSEREADRFPMDKAVKTRDEAIEVASEIASNLEWPLWPKEAKDPFDPITRAKIGMERMGLVRF